MAGPHGNLFSSTKDIVSFDGLVLNENSLLYDQKFEELSAMGNCTEKSNAK